MGRKQKLGPTKAFFVTVIKTLIESGIPFLVGGGYAMKRHTGLKRPTRDLDLFVLPSDTERVLRLFADRGYPVEIKFPHWLGKIFSGKAYVDVIFNSGNGVAAVDSGWFQHSVEDVVLGQPVRLCPVEEMIWSKAFVMERERFDGSDVNHLILARGKDLDWSRLLERFQSHRIVLLSHIVLFLFVYPSESERVPEWVWDQLLAQLEEARRDSRSAPRVCRGTLLSRGQYLEALETGYHDARLPPQGTLTRQDVLTWTKAGLEENKVP